FAVPSPLPAARCALAAPFHPCRAPGSGTPAVYFLWHFPWGRPRRALPGTAPPWSPDFPLPGPPIELGWRAAIPPSGSKEFRSGADPVKAHALALLSTRENRLHPRENRGSAMPVVLGTDGYRYEVAENWAKLPPGMEFNADVAAVGVDKNDNVYAFNR